MKQVLFIKFALFFSLFCICLFFACDENDTSQSENTEEVKEQVIKPESEQKKTTVLLINHKVADFNKWKQGFDKHKSIRQDYNVKVLYVFRSVVDSNNVTVLLQLNDLEDARKYATSQGLKETMRKCGVINKPNLKFLYAFQPTSNYNPGTCLLINHQVKDYNAWKKGFDEHESARNLYGLRALNIFNLYEDVNNVTILFEVQDLMTAQYYASSKKLKKSMEESGVISKLDISFVNTVQ